MGPRRRPSPSGCEPGHAVRLKPRSMAARTRASFLTLHGHEIHTSNDGPAALHLASEVALDVIFLNSGLPGMDDLKVAELLRVKHRENPSSLPSPAAATSKRRCARKSLHSTTTWTNPSTLPRCGALFPTATSGGREVVRSSGQRRPSAALRVRRVFSPFLTWSSPAATSGKSATSPSWKAEGSAARTSA
jgi:hypothetical protein